MKDLLSGERRPYGMTVEKIRTGIDNPPAPGTYRVQKPKPVPTKPIKFSNGNGIGNFVKNKLTEHIGVQRQSIKTMARRTDLSERDIRMMLAGNIPNEQALRQLGYKVPAIGNVMHELIKTYQGR